VKVYIAKNEIVITELNLIDLGDWIFLNLIQGKKNYNINDYAGYIEGWNKWRPLHDILLWGSLYVMQSSSREVTSLWNSHQRYVEQRTFNNPNESPPFKISPWCDWQDALEMFIEEMKSVGLKFYQSYKVVAEVCEKINSIRSQADQRHLLSTNMIDLVEIVTPEEMSYGLDFIGDWEKAGGKLIEGRMLARSDDSIWLRMSDFDLPYQPMRMSPYFYKVEDIKIKRDEGESNQIREALNNMSDQARREVREFLKKWKKKEGIQVEDVPLFGREISLARFLKPKEINLLSIKMPWSRS